MVSEEGHYDAVVLGSGPSGRIVAQRLAKNSFSVALVENELVGGDCSQSGYLGPDSLPSK
jgi:pyruvate/2-oxoglutarate dehydrogenase complex dihydrolipoamide dehydrogenase (E3) component